MTGRERWKAVGAWLKATMKAWIADLREEAAPHGVTTVFAVVLWEMGKTLIGMYFA